MISPAPRNSCAIRFAIWTDDDFLPARLTLMEEFNVHMTDSDARNDRDQVSTGYATVSVTVDENNADDKITIEEIREAIGVSDKNTIDRFSNIRTIGIGGIGSVAAGYEPVLNREVAIKVLRPAFRNKRKSLERFIREARATAYIAHPNIVPVHELGVFDDIGPFFTMKRVEGVTLKYVLEQLDKKNKEFIDKYSLRSLLNIFISICQGVAYAHSKGIIHRDLKPANIMMGEYGEVMVMDWGLVKHLKQDMPTDTIAMDINSDIEQDAMLTIDGAISGTPAFMAPEQACGMTDEIDYKSDLYSLGAILYVMLTRKKSPFPEGLKTDEILGLNASGCIIPPRKRTPKLKIPVELNAIAMKAMSIDKEERYPSVRDLIRDVRNYLDDYPVSAYPEPIITRFIKSCRRHPVIPTTVAGALIALTVALGFQWMDRDIRFKSYIRLADDSIRSGDLMYFRAKSTLKKLRRLQSINSNSPDEELQDEVTRYEAEFNNYYDVASEFLTKIDSQDKSEVNDKLKHIFKMRLDYSLLSGNYKQTRKLVQLLRMSGKVDYFRMLRQDKDTYRKMYMVIDSEGGLDIATEPVPADISVMRLNENLEVKNSEIEEWGTSPFEKIGISAGSYLMLIKTPGHPTVRCPIMIRIGEISKLNVYIPENIPDGMAYIPAGNFYMGSNAIRMGQLHKHYLPGFFIKKFEVTFGEYLEFWKSLKKPEEKNKYASRVLLGGENMRMEKTWDDQGNLLPQFTPDLPVRGISYEAVNAYCQWLSKKTGKLCRLPTAEEWEKAARGVDGREFVWGNLTQNKSAMVRENEAATKEYPFGAPGGKFKDDESIYGVADMAGNLREYTQSRFGSNDSLLKVKGGSLATDYRSSRCAISSYAGLTFNDIGFRYVMPLEDNTSDKEAAN